MYHCHGARQVWLPKFRREEELGRRDPTLPRRGDVVLVGFPVLGLAWGHPFCRISATGVLWMAKEINRGQTKPRCVLLILQFYDQNAWMRFGLGPLRLLLSALLLLKSQMRRDFSGWRTW